MAELQQITRPQQGQSSIRPINADIPAKMSLIEAVHTAVQRRPEIAQSISSLSAQAANINVAKAAY